MRHRGPRADRPPVMRRGDRVIDGRVRARLLGLPLLEIDAHVVVTTARAGTEATVIEADEGVHRSVRAVGPATPELAHAVRLLAQGSRALDDARRLR